MSITGSFALMATAAFLVPAQVQAKPSKTWVIGEVAPLTGPVATVGARLNNVVKMWAEDINAKGGIAGRKIELDHLQRRSQAREGGRLHARHHGQESGHDFR